MSLPALIWAWKCGHRDKHEVMVLTALAHHADNAGLTWVGQETIAHELHLGVRTVRDALARLETRHLIHRDRRSRGGGRATDLTRLAIDPELLPPKMAAKWLATFARPANIGRLSATVPGLPRSAEGGDSLPEPRSGLSNSGPSAPGNDLDSGSRHEVEMMLLELLGSDVKTTTDPLNAGADTVELPEYPVPKAPHAGGNRHATPVATGMRRRQTSMEYTANEDQHDLPEHVPKSVGTDFQERDRLTADIVDTFDGLLADGFPGRSKVPIEWSQYDPDLIRATMKTVAARLRGKKQQKRIYSWRYLTAALRGS